MSKVKLSLYNLTPAQLVAKAEQIVTTLSGNPLFPAPHPPLAQISSAVEALDLAIAETQSARQTATTKTRIMHDKEAELDGLVRQLSNYIESVSGEDEATILSAGLSVRNQAK